MTLTVTGRHLEIPPLVKEQIEKKFARLERVLGDSALSAQCIVGRVRQQHVCEITMHVRGDPPPVAAGRHERLLSAVGAAIEKIAQQAKRITGRWKTRRRTAKPTAEVAAAMPAPTRAKRAKAPASPVVRARRYAVRTLTADEAARQLGDASFLVFRLATTGAVAVVFRRPDGRVGLIEPEP